MTYTWLKGRSRMESRVPLANGPASRFSGERESESKAARPRISVPYQVSEAVPSSAHWSFRAIPLFPIQPKLEIGPSDDPLEREADAIAERNSYSTQLCLTGSARWRYTSAHKKGGLKILSIRTINEPGDEYEREADRAAARVMPGAGEPLAGRWKAIEDFHRYHPDSPYRGVQVKYLFPTWGDAMNPNCATRAGFTHLLGDAKSSPAVGKRIEERVKRENPGFFRRCE